MYVTGRSPRAAPPSPDSRTCIRSASAVNEGCPLSVKKHHLAVEQRVADLLGQV